MLLNTSVQNRAFTIFLATWTQCVLHTRSDIRYSSPAATHFQAEPISILQVHLCVFTMDHIERVPFQTPVLLSSLQDVLGSLSPPPLPIALTSLEHVVYGTKMSADQSRVLILLFAHPALQLDEVRLVDGWTRINKRARVILEAIIGVKVDSRWLDELTAYWDALPADVKRVLQHKHGALTEVASAGKASGKRRTMGENAQHDHKVEDTAQLDDAIEAHEIPQPRATRQRRAVNGNSGRENDSAAGSATQARGEVLPAFAHQDADAFADLSQPTHATSSVSYCAQLVELHRTIVNAFDKYNDMLVSWKNARKSLLPWRRESDSGTIRRRSCDHSCKQSRHSWKKRRAICQRTRRR